MGPKRAGLKRGRGPETGAPEWGMENSDGAVRPVLGPKRGEAETGWAETGRAETGRAETGRAERRG